LFLCQRPPPTSTLFSLHDALPISRDDDRAADRDDRQTRERNHEHLARRDERQQRSRQRREDDVENRPGKQNLEGQNRLDVLARRSEEHTSELQSLAYLVCRLLLEK